MTLQWFARLACVCAVALAAAAVSAANGSASPYVARDLGTLGGDFTNSMAFAINDNGTVVGTSNMAVAPYTERGFVWTRAGGMIDIGDLGGSPTRPVAVNNAGDVVGWANTASGAQHAFFWSSTTGMVDIGATTGSALSQATAINDQGVVVGSMGTTPTGWPFHAFAWTRHGGLVDLGAPGGYSSVAQDVNAVGQVVGQVITSNGAHAFLWNPDGSTVDLGALSPVGPAGANDVNNLGQIVGSTNTPTAASEPFIWTEVDGMVGLGGLGGTYGSARYINDDGIVAGDSQTSSGRYHAFVWTHAGGLTDLGTLGGLDSWVDGVTDDGEVIGTTSDLSQYSKVFVWTPDSGMVGIGDGGAAAVSHSGEIAGYGPGGPGWARIHAYVWTRIDTTPPTLTVPSGVTVDATGPSGAVVSYAVTATDDSGVTPVVTCTPPSGSVVAVGTTTVECIATDSSGNDAHASFTVHVTGAAEQLADLGNAVIGVGPGTSLADKMSDTQTALRGNDTSGACSIMTAFINQVNAQTGKSVASNMAAAFITDATRIKAVLGC